MLPGSSVTQWLGHDEGKGESSELKAQLIHTHTHTAESTVRRIEQIQCMKMATPLFSMRKVELWVLTFLLYNDQEMAS